MEGVITHEVGHVLGLFHEQARTDRDDYVTINWANIPEVARQNFQILGEDAMNAYGVPYDYKSIMHYSSTVSHKSFFNQSGISYDYKSIMHYSSTMSHKRSISLQDYLFSVRSTL
jgi:hypothetical protein